MLPYRRQPEDERPTCQAAHCRGRWGVLLHRRSPLPWHSFRAPSSQLGFAAGDASLNIKALKGQPGLYRLRVGDWRAVFIRSGHDFLVAAIGLRKDIYERVGRMRLARKGEGLRVIEVAPPLAGVSDASSHARVRARARAPKAVEQNPLTPSATPS